jgi:hypothetical protein
MNISANTTNSVNYVLYAHFEDETQGAEPQLNLEKHKENFTYKMNKVEKKYYEDKIIDDNQLKGFLKRFRFVFGKEFDTQQREVIQKPKTQFNCSSDFEADTLYYNNELRIVGPFF